MIDQITIDRIFAAANIVEVVSDFVALKRNGANYKACCPFHNEKTPSFVVSPAKGLYKCFGCSKGGNAISFVMEHESLSYVEALKYVAKKYHIEVQETQQTAEDIARNDNRESMMIVNSFAYDYFRKQLVHSDEGRAVGLSYFKERGFTDTTIEKFGLGYCPAQGDSFSMTAISEGYKEEFLVGTGLTIKREQGGYYDRFAGRVQFPIFSISGRVIAFGGRTLRTDKKVAKYLNSPESEVYHKSNTLYGIFQAKKAIVENNYCILVEGYTDVIQLFQSGVENVVASSGTSLTVEQVRLISRFTKNVTVIYDGDSAGIKASMRGIDIILKEGLNVRVVLLEEGEDPDSFAKSHTAEQVEEYIHRNEVDFITFKTGLLLEEVKGDPVGRAAVITDIVNSISVIPDEIVRYQYIKETSALLETDIDLIQREVAKRVNDALHGAAGREVFRNEQRKEQYLKRIEQQNEPIVISTAKATDTLERELLVYLLKYNHRDFFFTQRDAEGRLTEPVKLNVAETIIEEMNVDNIVFSNDTYRTLYNEFVAEWERVKKHNESLEAEDAERRAVTLNAFVNHPSKEVCSFVVDLMTSQESYQASKIWSKYDETVITEADNLDIAIPKTIAVYKLLVIGEMKKELLSTIQNISEQEAMDLLKQIGALDEIRRIICGKYSRVI